MLTKLDPNTALVLFSGGQDSATVLGWALSRFDRVATIGFDYGQRHRVELETRAQLREHVAEHDFGWPGKLDGDRLLDIGALGEISDTALTREREIELSDSGLPSTFVPGRNLVFLTLASAYAYRIGAGALVAGMCETDFSGYPDCRRETLHAQMQAISLGMDAKFHLYTPLMHIDKAQSWHLANALGGEAFVTLINQNSHTCYLGERGTLHDWGYGCGTCPACELRAKGWRRYASERMADGPHQDEWVSKIATPSWREAV